MRSSSGWNSLAALVALLFAACAGAPPARAPGARSVEGTILVDGERPDDRRVMLALRDGSRLALQAPAFAAELLRLDGLGVRVTGREIPSAAEPAFAAGGYELLPIDGVAPIVGVVARQDGEAVIRTAAGALTTRLAGPLAGALLTHEGMKVWVWGDRSDGDDGALLVEAYGVLGPAGTVTRR